MVYKTEVFSLDQDYFPKGSFKLHYVLCSVAYSSNLKIYYVWNKQSLYASHILFGLTKQ
jgi:hypothetical protein